MPIDVLPRGSDGYEANRGAFNVLLSQDPAGIVTAAGTADVVDAVEYAKAEGLRIGAQRTGHGAEPLLDLSGTLLVRTAAMDTVSIDGDDVVSDWITAIPASHNDQPDARVEHRDIAAKLRTALAKIPPVQRDAFLLQQESGLSLLEIATLTGVGVETVKSRLRYAIAKLRGELGALREWAPR